MTQNPSQSQTNSSPHPRNYAWIWICYTGFLFIQPFYDPSLHLWIATLSVFGIFLTIFIRYMQVADSERPLRLWMILATLILGLLTFPWNQGASCLFVYAASFLPFTIPSVRRVLWLFAAESALVLGEAWLFHGHRFGLHVSLVNALIAVFLTLVIGVGQIFFAEQKRADCRLRAAQEENITLAAVAERERIARDLHDVLGHTLSVIVLKAELANRLLQRNLDATSSPDLLRATSEIADVERTARTALSEVREAIGGYRSQGLAAEIEAARRTLDAAGVTLITDEMGAPGPSSRTWDGITATSSETLPLTANEETVLSLALREAVTNIVRHAQATTCRLRFVTPPDSMTGRRRLVIEDDGQHIATREGNGLRGMRERVESVGGTLSLERDRGTRLLIELPLRREAAAS